MFSLAFSFVSESQLNYETLALITRAAEKYDVSASVLIRVAICESGFKRNAVGQANEYGTFQYMEKTWEQFSKEFGRPMNIKSIEDQATLTAWAFSRGYQRHWTTYRALKANNALTGEFHHRKGDNDCV